MICVDRSLFSFAFKARSVRNTRVVSRKLPSSPSWSSSKKTWDLLQAVRSSGEPLNRPEPLHVVPIANQSVFNRVSENKYTPSGLGCVAAVVTWLCRVEDSSFGVPNNGWQRLARDPFP